MDDPQVQKRLNAILGLATEKSRSARLEKMQSFFETFVAQGPTRPMFANLHSFAAAWLLGEDPW
ncbi:MAG: hypothetical protein JW940_09345 [Polyangiaceae bacterium]|nr:hypothetical protein [Polyangiaceae bacterium]